jgi:hypothetical protein
MRSICRAMRIVLAGDHGLDHPPTAHTHQVADHPAELDVGFFERLLEALDMPGLLANQLLAGPHQRAQFLDVFPRHEARLDQPAGQEIGDPHRIVHVRLAAGNSLDRPALTTISSNGPSLRMFQTGFR